MNNSYKNINFINSLKIQSDKETEFLLKIQDEIEKRGINKNTVLQLTKSLSKEQKAKLKQLYNQQISDFQMSTQNYKQHILKIRNNLA